MDAAHQDLVDRLAQELERLGMRRHLARLGDYRRGRGETWTRAHVEQLAAVLRVPPFESVYPVKPRMSSCGCPTPSMYTAAVVPGAALFKCNRCPVEWLELG